MIFKKSVPTTLMMSCGISGGVRGIHGSRIDLSCSFRVTIFKLGQHPGELTYRDIGFLECFGRSGDDMT